MNDCACQIFCGAKVSDEKWDAGIYLCPECESNNCVWDNNKVEVNMAEPSFNTPGDYADESYEPTSLGRKIHSQGYDSIPEPIDWQDQLVTVFDTVNSLATNTHVRKKLNKYDPALLGKLDATKDHLERSQAGHIAVGKTAMSNIAVNTLAEAILGLPISKKNRAAIGYTLIPTLRRANSKFDPYRFMEKLVG